MAEDFYSRYNSDYGYEGQIEAIRETEFPNLNENVYLDHAGATLYCKSQLENYHNDLMKNIYGNPHSGSWSSEQTLHMIDDVRQEILSYFKTTSDDYHVVFTANSTHAIKLVAESFMFHRSKDFMVSESNFVYLQDNHTSVVGIRAVALEKGATVRTINYHKFSQDILAVPFENGSKIDGKASDSLTTKACPSLQNTPYNLFAYPAMSNFSGHKYPLEWIVSVQDKCLFSNKRSGKWFVLLDAASYVSTSQLDLGMYHPDFVPISFYKIFGFPTGLGALLVSARGAQALTKTYFGGGSVSAYSSDTHFQVFKSSLQDRYKDGTPPFLEILAVRHGFRSLCKLTTSIDLITKHTFCLAQYVYNKLVDLKHYNQHSVCECYCDTEFNSTSVQGPIINFNILRSDGTYVGYAQVSKLAAVYHIHLRTGCFCNVGACQHFLNLTTSQLQQHFNAGHVCGDSIDIIDGRPTGSIRISFGYMSNFADAETFLNFIKDCFVEKVDINICNGNTPAEIHTENNKVLKRIFLYPVKSCAAFEVEQWKLNEKGFYYDREWLIVNDSGSFISQKREPRLCFIQPCIDLKRDILQLQAPGMSACILPLALSGDDVKDRLIIQPRVCGTKVSGIDCGDDVSRWLTSFLKIKCRLLRQDPNIIRKINLNQDTNGGSKEQALSLANNSQLVIITEESCLDLIKNINTSIDEDAKKCELTMETLIQRFRPNLVISGVNAYEEESWSCVTIGTCGFECCGVCFRCQMISVDSKSGERSKEPLKTLAKLRGSKIPFGVHLLQKMTETNAHLHVGALVEQIVKTELE